MSNRKLVPVLAVLAAVAVASVPATSFADAPTSAACPLRKHHITSVKPYRVTKRLGRTVVKRLRGAEVFVQAEPGLTAEWLELTLARHIVEMRGPVTMAGCPFDVDGVAVQVDAGGTGFRVRITARNTDQAEEVLRRAQSLLS